MNFNFFENKKILITGNTGFKGSWLSLWLSELKANVCGYSRNDKNDKFFRLLKLDQKIKHHEGDICDLNALRKFVHEEKPEIIFHMAAQSLVRRSYSDPIDTFETNVMGSVNLLETLRNVDSVRAVVYVTTDKCYLNKNTTKGYVEADELGGKDPYSASKACSELVMKSYYHSFLNTKKDFAICSARGGNVLGGGDFSENRLIPDLVRALEKNEPLLIRNPTFIRPWQHVLDCLYGYMKLAQIAYDKPGKLNGESWNFGPNEPNMMSVEKVIQIFIKNFGRGSYEIERDGILHEEKTLFLDISKAKEQLLWAPKFDYTNTIQATAEWYKDFLNSKNVTEITLNQIHQYMKSIS